MIPVGPKSEIVRPICRVFLYHEEQLDPLLERRSKKFKCLPSRGIVKREIVNKAKESAANQDSFIPAGGEYPRWRQLSGTSSARAGKREKNTQQPLS